MQLHIAFLCASAGKPITSARQANNSSPCCCTHCVYTGHTLLRLPTASQHKHLHRFFVCLCIGPERQMKRSIGTCKRKHPPSTLTFFLTDRYDCRTYSTLTFFLTDWYDCRIYSTLIFFLDWLIWLPYLFHTYFFLDWLIWLPYLFFNWGNRRTSADHTWHGAGPKTAVVFGWSTERDLTVWFI